MIKSVFNKIKIALFPKRCDICGKVVEFDTALCSDCASLKHIEAPLCLKCGCSKKDCICSKSKRSPEYKAVIAPFYYEKTIADGVLNFKMNEMPMLAARQGAEIAACVKSFYELIDFDFVTYVPMLKYDEKYRGFNQSELLAAVVSEACGIPIADALYKKRKTKMQKRQSAKDRFINMYNVFGIHDGMDLSGKTVLLIDDVKTTGATLSSAALTLKAYGAKAVYCAVFAIVK